MASQTKVIPYGKQNIDSADIEAVVQVLRSDYLTQGPLIEEFEAAFAKKCGSRYAVAVTNATSALHIAYLAAGLKKGRRVWTTPISFLATANAGLYCQAEVDFVDIDLATFNLCPIALKKKLQDARANGLPLPDLVVPVHLGGQAPDLKAIAELSREYGFQVIEDAAHAVGASYENRPVGNCDYSLGTVFSFHPVKIMTTGEGGVITTQNKQFYETLKLLRNHGMTRNPDQFQNQSLGPWYYEQIELGFNYRITDLQCALGLSQLKRLDHFLESRREIAVRYDDQLKSLPVEIPCRAKDTNSAWHLYVIRLQGNATPERHRAFHEGMISRGIRVNLHYYPIYRQPFYQKLGFSGGLCPNAEIYAATALTLPVYYDFSKSDQTYVVDSLKSVLTDFQ